MTLNVPCEFDSDCPGTLVCYQNVSWAKDSIFCDCSNWYGWTGNDCTDFGPGSIFLLTCSSLALLIAAVVLVLTIYIDGSHIIKEKLSWKSFMVTTWIYTSLGLLFHILWRIITILLVVQPEERAEREEKVPLLLPYERVFISLTYLFNVNSQLHISVCWLETAYKAARMIQAHIPVVRYRYAIYAAEFLCTVILFTSMVTGNFFVLFVTIIPLQFLLLLSTTFGRIQIVKLIKKLSDHEQSQNAQHRQAGRLMTAIKNTSMALVISQICFMILIVTFIFFLSWKEYIETGTIGVPIVLSELLKTAILAILLVVLHFVRSRFWDNTNTNVDSTARVSKCTSTETSAVGINDRTPANAGQTFTNSSLRGHSI